MGRLAMKITNDAKATHLISTNRGKTPKGATAIFDTDASTLATNLQPGGALETTRREPIEN